MLRLGDRGMLIARLYKSNTEYRRARCHYGLLGALLAVLGRHAKPEERDEVRDFSHERGTAAAAFSTLALWERM